MDPGLALRKRVLEQRTHARDLVEQNAARLDIGDDRLTGPLGEDRDERRHVADAPGDQIGLNGRAARRVDGEGDGGQARQFEGALDGGLQARQGQAGTDRAEGADDA